MMVQPVKMLRWLYVGRMTLAAGVFVGAVLVWPSVTPVNTLIATLALLAALFFTAGSWWYTNVLGRPAGSNFLYAQLVFDTLLITAIVHSTNGPDSSFPPLYILVIAAGALLLPLPGGVLIGALASILYFADLFWFHPDIATDQHVNLFFFQVPAAQADALLQIGLFAVVALTTGALGDRLRRTGHALGQMESELRQLRLDTDDILGAVDTGLVTVDEAGRLVYMNVAAESFLGLHAVNWRTHAVIDELDRRAPGLGTVIRRTLATRVPVRRYEIRLREADAERVLSVRTTVLERSGSPSVTAVFQDVTDSRQIEELLRRTERLQAVAELGASLAHEIKNPLASIRSAVEQLAGSSSLTDNDRGTLSRLVVAESNRVSRLLSEFMEFSRVELRKRSAVDLARLTTEAIGLVAQHPDAQGGARIVYEPPANPLMVDGDPDLLHRAVFNLVLNAVQHSGNHGEVHIELGVPNGHNVPPSVELDAAVRLCVRDSGPGIPAEDIPRVFDPFFTTRQGGTGLGLAMVHRAVEAHHGTILVDGGSGDGAEFTVYLPTQTRSM